MGIRINISRKTKKLLRDFLAATIHGNCYHFAIAMHRGLGWPIVGLVQNREIIHAGVKSPGDEKFWDGRGALSRKEFIEPFACDYLRFSDITEEDLAISKNFSEHAVEILLEKAQLAWPELPWKVETFQEKIIAFAKELKELSQKHGIWICASLPNGPPVIFKGEGDELGYRLTLSVEGNAFMINRELN